MKHVTFWSFCIGIIALLSSCNNFSGGGLMSASAATSEVLVLMEDDGYASESGQALKSLLRSPVKGLPQIEPNFTVIQVSPKNFTSTFKMVRNIVVPDISNVYSKPALKAELDKYAVGQLVLKINAPDSASFIQFLTENQEQIVNYILSKELTRTAAWLKQDANVSQKIFEDMFGIHIFYQKGLTKVFTKPDFYWATNDAAQGRRDIVIYQYPYTSEKQFEIDSLIAKRNEILGKYIKGSYDSQITTVTKSYQPNYRRLEVGGEFRAEFRGLWEMTTDMMGGPFVSQAFVNPFTNKLVVAEVFVFAPEKDKRNLIRNMEAALYTIECVNTQTSTDKKNNKK